VKWTRTVTTEVKVTPWRPFGHYGFARVRVWVQTDGKRWWQCHEWGREGGNGETWAEGWISGPRGWPKEAMEPDPFDEIPGE
jgi:hypothetical protein